MNQIKNLFRSGFFLYVMIFMIGYVLIDQEKVKEAIKIRTLNNSMAGCSTALLWSVARGEKFEPSELMRNRDYYSNISAYFPGRAEGYGLTGFCSFYTNLVHPEWAGNLYQEAIQRNPYFFWYYYNLGLIEFKQKHYVASANLFTQALKMPIEAVIVTIQQSPQLYGNILDAMPFTKKAFELHIKGGYKNAVLLILESQLRLKKYDEVLSLATTFEKQGMIERKTYLYYAGLAAYYIQQYPQAAILLREYLQMEPFDARAGYVLGRALVALGALREAEQITIVYPDPTIGETLSSSLDQLQLQPY
jgi:tetratricopeptide (TPR) repeat protein